MWKGLPARPLLFSLWTYAAFASPHRALLQAAADIVAEDQFAPVFQLVSNTTQPFLPAGTVTGFTATLEMDTAASFSQKWVSGRPDNASWADGNTRWNLTGNFTSAAAPLFMASLHTIPCPSGQDSFTEADVYVSPTNPDVQLLGQFQVSEGMRTFTVTYPFLIDYDAVQSLALYAGNLSTGPGLAACANWLPPRPDFPSDWSSMIETTSVDRGTTFVLRQLYSQTLNKARLDLTSYAKERVGIADFAANNMTFISPANETYPHGVCNYSEIPRFLSDVTDESNTSLVDTSQFLRFDYARVTYSPGHETIRGIECEKWALSDSFESGFRNASGTYNVTFYFPVNQWQIGRQDYHRLLKETRVSGQLDDGDTFELYQEYVNFKPQNYTNNSAAFDVCALAPQGENCGCTRDRIAALNGLTLDSDPDSVNIQGSNSENGAYQLQSGNPHGFISSQAGPYIGLVIIGLVAGALFAVLGTWLFLRRRYAGMGHSRFEDAPASRPSFGFGAK